MVRSIIFSAIAIALFAVVRAAPASPLVDVVTQDIGVKDIELENVLNDVVDVNDLNISNNLNGISILSSDSPYYGSAEERERFERVNRASSNDREFESPCEKKKKNKSNDGPRQQNNGC